MTRAQRLEAGLALAMLPVGAVLALVSAVAFLAVLLLLGISFVFEDRWPWVAAWSGVSTLVAVRNIVASIAVVNALDWRPLIAIGLLSAAVLVTCPFLW